MRYAVHTHTEKSPKLPVATYVAAISDFFPFFSGLFLFFFSEFLKALNDLRKYAEKPETQERIGTQFTCFTSTKVQILTQKLETGKLLAPFVAANKPTSDS